MTRDNAVWRLPVAVSDVAPSRNQAYAKRGCTAMAFPAHAAARAVNTTKGVQVLNCAAVTNAMASRGSTRGRGM